MSDPDEYSVGWICAISSEYTAAQAFLDEKHEGPEHVSPHDNNDYTLGKIGKHKVVIAVLPDGEYGTSSAASVARDMLHSFSNIRIGLMVGIGGGAPSSKHDIRLGDIVVSAPRNGIGGIFQYDFGKAIHNQGFQATGILNQPPTALRTAVNGLKSQYECEGHQLERMINSVLKKKPRLWKKYKRPDQDSDKLYRSDFIHALDDAGCEVVCGDEPSHLILRPERTEDMDNPKIHYGLIASANQLMKDASIRDRLATEKDVLCFEMETAGLINHFPCLAIRGICDYADSHKSKDWQGYAAMIAAAYARDLLYRLAPNRVKNEKRISELLSGIHATISKIDYNVTTLSSKLDRKEDLKALDWLSRIDYGPQQSDYLRQRQPGTGQWLLESIEYQNWRNTDNQTLFCPGIPGAGKTMMTALVINDLTAQCLANQNIGLAYIYCSFRRKDEQKNEDLLASIVKQLAQCQASLPRSLRMLYEQHRDRRTRPSLDELSKGLQSVVSGYTMVFLVIDALDECQVLDDCRNMFLSQLFDLQRRFRVKVFATARPIPEITQRFIGNQLEIRAQESDVRQYLEGRISQSESELLGTYKEEIKSRITDVVDGMFLLAKLHFDSIKAKMTLKQVKEALKNLQTTPEAYTQAYENAMGRIQEQSREASQLAIEILMWITCAKRQLNTSELQDALAVEKGEPNLNRENVPQLKDIVSICAGLVAVDEESKIIRLVHYTTQDYFERKQSHWFPYAELSLTVACVTYLSFDVFARGFCLSDEEFEAQLLQNPLYDYAARNWGHHARTYGKGTEDIIHGFLNNDAKVSASSQALTISVFKWSSGYSQRVPKEMTALHLTAYFGLNEATSYLLKTQEHPDSQDTHGRSPLSWAASCGHETVVRLLLQKGANMNKRDKDGRTPPSWAAGNGHETVLGLLLENGAPVESRDGSGRTPLSWAANNGHEAVVKLLLKKSADIKSTADIKSSPYVFSIASGQTPLLFAVMKGHEAVVRLLLEKGACIEERNSSDQTPLSLAAWIGYENVVKLLLEKGAETKTTDAAYGKTPLFWAAERGNETVVRLLIQKGANMNKRDNSGRTPLSWAAENGQETVVKLLLKKGAHVELGDGLGQTPLSWAARNGHVTVVKLLIENGTDIEVRDSYNGQTPLSWAAEEGYENVVKLLLKEGADIESGDAFARTPLSWAAWKGHKTVVKLLLRRGANIHSRDNSGRTPLSWAAGNEHGIVIKLLLKKGADIETEDYTGRTPLSWAAENLHDTVLKVLLEKGADIRSRDTSGRTPLSWATMSGQETARKVLLRKDTDTYMRDKYN